MRDVVAAVVQMTARGVVADNLRRARELVTAAARAGAEIIVLPENFAHLRVPGADPQPAGALTGGIVAEMATLARDVASVLVLGSIPERAGSDPRPFSTLVVLGPTGAIRAAYRKRHLFDVVLPDGKELRESASYQAGADPVAVDTPWGVMGLAICYDLRFPEHFRALVDRGAEILCTPSAFTARTGRDHWHLLVRARAVENQSFVLAANQWGHHGGDRESFGHSLIADPWGEVLAEIPEGEGFVLARLEAARIARVRSEFPALQHRQHRTVTHATPQPAARPPAPAAISEEARSDHGF